MHQKIKFIPMKIHNTVASRAALFGPDMHHWGSLQRSPRPLAGLRGPTSKGRGGEEGGGEGMVLGPPLNEFLDPPLRPFICFRNQKYILCQHAFAAE